jgi:hypothetical protein
LGAYVFLLPDPAHHPWLRERILRFVRQECHGYLRGQPLLLA